jgi:methyl-accepting chemotaxis protein
MPDQHLRRTAGNQMKWNDIHIKTKLGITFGIGVLILVATSVTGIILMDKVESTAARSVSKALYSASFLEKQIAHMVWTERLESYVLARKNEKVALQTDGHLCVFGKWYYSDDVGKARQLMPELDNYFASVEKPHLDLHNTAVIIEKLMLKGEFDRAEEVFTKETRAYSGEVINILAKMGEIANKQALDDQASFTSNARTAQII